jgi:DNA-binding transcriptional regulator YdaS (Cro superfamily)
MKNYWKKLSNKEKLDLAIAANTTKEYLRQVFLYKKKVGAVMALTLEKLTGVPRYELRPDIYPPEEYKKAS